MSLKAAFLRFVRAKALLIRFCHTPVLGFLRRIYALKLWLLQVFLPQYCRYFLQTPRILEKCSHLRVLKQSFNAHMVRVWDFSWFEVYFVIFSYNFQYFFS